MVTPVTVSPKVCTRKTPTPPTKYPNKVMFPTNRRIDNIISIFVTFRFTDKIIDSTSKYD